MRASVGTRYAGVPSDGVLTARRVARDAEVASLGTGRLMPDYGPSPTRA